MRGLDFAVASGQLAAEAACDAVDAQDTSSSRLASYRGAMENSFVLQDLATFKDWPRTMEHWDGMFRDYPRLFGQILDGLFVVDGKPQKHLVKRIMPTVREYGLLKLLKEMKGALKAL